jgi:hypothetical protein
MEKRKFSIAVVAVLLLAGAAWAYSRIGRTDPVVAEMQQLRDQMFQNRDLPEADRRAQWQDFRQRMDGLTDAQRAALRDGGREQWQQFGQQRMNEFFALPRAEQNKRLDDMIDRMMAREKERQQNPNANQRGGGRGGNRGNLTDAQRDQRRKERLDRTDPKMRAQFTEFGRRMNERRAERGLPPMQGGPGRGGFGGGGPWRG